MIWTVEANAQGITRIRDGRCGGADLLNGKGECGRILYTLREEDVRRLPKPDFTPHAQHTVLPAPTEIAAERVRCEDAALGVTFELCTEGDALRLHWAYENRRFSQFAASLPLNFMSQKNGEWTAQLLVSSPWFDRESGRLLCLFTRPNGQHVGLVCETPVESFRIGYSSALFGHFFTDFEIHAVQDRVYGSTPRDRAELTAWLYPVASYEELLQRAAALWRVPAARYTRSDCRIGESFAVRVTPDCDTVRLYSPDGKCSVYPVSDGMAHIPAAVYGLHRMVPCRGEAEGIGCIGFAHDDWRSLWRRSIDSVPVRREEVYAHTADGQPVWMPPTVTYRGYVDSNACEHTMWAWSLLRYLRHFPIDAGAEDGLRNGLRILTATDPALFRPCQTLVASAQHESGLPPYNTYRSDRLQEAFQAISILLDAWRVYGDPQYGETAVAALTAQLNDTMENGCIRRRTGADYTTVTALIFPVIDLYRELSARGDGRAARFAAAAEQIADFVTARDLDFPTEGGISKDFSREMEEGSMACSALTVLYAAYFLKRKPAWLEFAARVLRLHDAFCIRTCTAPMFHSSLRWWENLWEGDADGPALCCGHAWSVWRGEAEYWLGLLTHDGARLLDSYNTFLSNFSKEDAAGNLYALWQCEPMISGAWEAADAVDRRYAVGFPHTKDITLSRYVFARAEETWFGCTALVRTEDGPQWLNGRIEDGRLVSDAPLFRTLYLDELSAPLRVEAAGELTVICAVPVRVTAGQLVCSDENGLHIRPDSDGIIGLAP